MAATVSRLTPPLASSRGVERSPAQVVVVHGGQVVVNEGIRVHHFHRAGGDQSVDGQAAAGFRRGQAKHGAHSLAARKHAVAHGLVDSFGAFVLGGKEPVQRRVDQGALLGNVIFQRLFTHGV